MQRGFLIINILDYPGTSRFNDKYDFLHFNGSRKTLNQWNIRYRLFDSDATNEEKETEKSFRPGRYLFSLLRQNIYFRIYPFRFRYGTRSRTGHITRTELRDHSNPGCFQRVFEPFFIQSRQTFTPYGVLNAGKHFKSIFRVSLLFFQKLRPGKGHKKQNQHGKIIRGRGNQLPEHRHQVKNAAGHQEIR